MIETFEIERQYTPYSQFSDPMQQATADMLSLLTVRLIINDCVSISFDIRRESLKGNLTSEIWISRAGHVSQKWFATADDINTLVEEIEKGMLTLEMLDLRVRRLIQKSLDDAKEYPRDDGSVAFIVEADAVLKEMSENAGIQ